MSIDINKEIDITRPLLNLNNLEIGYDETLVSNINLEVKPGEIISIVGASGIGKTTLLRTIAGLVAPLSGTIKTNVEKRGGLGYIPQKLGLVRHTSVMHNVMMGARAGIKTSSPQIGFFIGTILGVFLGILLGIKIGNFFWIIFCGFTGFFLGSLIGELFAAIFEIPPKLSRERASQAIKTMGISDKVSEPVRRLSGGQQRRVATARTLAQRPKLILADEFLSELDEDNINIVIDSVTNYIKETNSAMLIIEHDIKRAEEISSRMYIVDDGEMKPYQPNFSKKEEEE